MTNSDFLAALYGEIGTGFFGWVSTFRVNPGEATPDMWAGRSYKGLPNQAAVLDRAVSENTYFTPALLSAGDNGETARKKSCFHRLMALVLDDAMPDDIQNFSWSFQTSPGKFQIGILLDEDDQDCQRLELIDRIMVSLASRGYVQADASGNNAVRLARLPAGMNTKPRPAGDWKVQVEHWNPNVRWSLDDACGFCGIDLDALKQSVAIDATRTRTQSAEPSRAGDLVHRMTGPLDERSYHDSIRDLAASLIAGGMFPGAVVNHLYSLMDEARPVGPDEEIRRWEERRAEIPRAVKSAEKYAPPERVQAPITVNLSTDREVKPASDLVPMDWLALDGTEPEATQWHLDGWLPAGTVTLLSANGGVGKSNLSLQLGVALAHGNPFFERETAPARVLVLSGEDEARTVHFRVANICKHSGVSMASLKDRLTVYDLTQVDCVLWRDGEPTTRMQWLADVVKLHQADVVIIDNASDVFADSENDRAAVRGFMRCLNLVAGVSRASMLLLAHVDKASVRSGAGNDSMTTFSGSTAWNNSARSRWAMVREENAVLVRHEKCNLGPLQEDVRLEFEPIEKVFVSFGSSPGLKAAAVLMRSSHRIALLRMIDQAANAGANLSMKVNSPTNAFVALREHPDFPRIDRREFFDVLRELERDRLIEAAAFTRSNRTVGSRVVLTESGRMKLVAGSGSRPHWVNE